MFWTVRSNHFEGTDGWVRLSGISLASKRIVSRQIAGLHTLKPCQTALLWLLASHSVCVDDGTSAPLSGVSSQNVLAFWYVL